MSRYIDADALVIDYYDDYETKDDEYTYAYVSKSQIDNAPTIDAVEVVHGEWIPNPKIGWGETWVCSICGERTTSSVMGKPRYRYCPWCGAKMKGADDE